VSRAERIERALLEFFAAPTNGATAGLFRLGFGLLACWQCVGVWLNLHRYWGDQGLVPFRIVQSESYVWMSPFSWAPQSELVLYGHGVAFTVASVAMLLGVFPRAASLLLAFVHLSLQFRNPFILNSGDRLFMILAALASLMPLGHRYSLEAWWRERRGLGPREPSVLWGNRLLQLQIAYVYAAAFVSKIPNERWYKGMALRDVLASPVFAEFPTYVDSRPVLWALTYGTLLFELGFPLAIWWRRYRPWLIAAGVTFHVGIDLAMVIPIFSATMILSYLAFLDDDETETLVRALTPWRRRRPGAVEAKAPAELA
jgi:hypothetical protein